MSFANYDYEAQNPPPPSNELDGIISKTSRQLQSFGQLISQLDVQRQLIGTKRDSVQLRQQLDKLTDRTSELGGAIQQLILNLSRFINSPKEHLEVTNKQLVVKERLVSEFNELHRRFQALVRAYNDKKQTPLKTVVEEAAPASESTPLLQPQVQIQEDEVNQTELEYHLLLTEERNREINQVSEGIHEVNTIFKDLGELVHQQGGQLDTIEDNIFQLHNNAQLADKELRKADAYQRSKGKWGCILLVAMSIIVLIVVLAVVS